MLFVHHRCRHVRIDDAACAVRSASWVSAQVRGDGSVIAYGVFAGANSFSLPTLF